MGHRNEIQVLFLPYPDKKDTILESTFPFLLVFFSPVHGAEQEGLLLMIKVIGTGIFFFLNQLCAQKARKNKTDTELLSCSPIYLNFNQIITYSPSFCCCTFPAEFHVILSPSGPFSKGKMKSVRAVKAAASAPHGQQQKLISNVNINCCFSHYTGKYKHINSWR